ncbi:Sucrase/ferredoxin-like-domain-containing protein [Ochromonadaceae sp. CCMP2298]|nr:Sucrase/ferredoxin-like-domain-containing protein [Ochromonadaceae sp. CCMP2298]
MSSYVPPGLVYFAASSTLMMMLSLQRRRAALSRVGARMASAIKDGLSEAGPSACDGCDVKPNNMIGSVKPYDRHVIICAPSDAWESDIGKHADAFPYTLIRFLEEGKPKKEPKDEEKEKQVVDDSKMESTESKEGKKSKGCKLKITALHEPTTHFTAQTHLCSVLVYPDNLLFRLAEPQLLAFSRLLQLPQPLKQHTLQQAGYDCTPPPWKRLALVCTHGSRDKRCGRAGPQVLDELNRLLAEQGVAPDDISVRASSHIGGHKFAGTMIVYPEGQWYGRVTKSTVPELLEHIKKGAVLEKCSRGATSSKVLQW